MNLQNILFKAHSGRTSSPAFRGVQDGEWNSSSAQLPAHLPVSAASAHSAAEKHQDGGRSWETKWGWTASIWSMVSLIPELREKGQMAGHGVGEEVLSLGPMVLSWIKTFWGWWILLYFWKDASSYSSPLTPLHNMGQPPVMCGVLPAVTSHKQENIRCNKQLPHPETVLRAFTYATTFNPPLG